MDGYAQITQTHGLNGFNVNGSPIADNEDVFFLNENGEMINLGSLIELKQRSFGKKGGTGIVIGKNNIEYGEPHTLIGRLFVRDHSEVLAEMVHKKVVNPIDAHRIASYFTTIRGYDSSVLDSKINKNVSGGKSKRRRGKRTIKTRGRKSRSRNPRGRK